MTVPTAFLKHLWIGPTQNPFLNQGYQQSRSMEVLQHVLQKVLDIRDEEKNKSFSKWMTYRRYDNFSDICAKFEFCNILHSIHDYSEFRADGPSSLVP